MHCHTLSSKRTSKLPPLNKQESISPKQTSSATIKRVSEDANNDCGRLKWQSTFQLDFIRSKLMIKVRIQHTANVNDGKTPSETLKL